MPLQSILDKRENLTKLIYCYSEKKMSTTDIASASKDLFGSHLCCAAIYNALIRNKISVRNKSESVSIATCTLDANTSFLNEGLFEWIDGFLLGDGCVNHKKDGSYRSARFTFGSVQKEWTVYAMSGLKDYAPITPWQSGEVCKKRPRLCWNSRTLTHPDIVLQAKRWYPNGKKIIPIDVRLTAQSILLWYLGDGSITQKGVIRLATCGFTPDDIDTILIPRLKEMGVEACRNEVKNDIRLSTASVSRFFDIIGKTSPIKCYSYKFEYAPWLDLYRISDIAKDDKEKWRIQYLYKMGKLDCRKSPGDKIILFTEEQKQKIRQILDDHGSHEEYPEKETEETSSNFNDRIRVSDIVKSDVERWNARYFMTRGVVEHESGSMFTPEQALLLRQKLDEYRDKSAIPEYMIDVGFRKFRESGFPYYSFSEDHIIDKIKTIANFIPVAEDGLYKWVGTGTEIANFFHPQMFECRKKGKMSPIEFFNSDSDFRRGIKKLIALYPELTVSNIREICCNETASSRINNFPPRVAMTVLKHLYPDQKITMMDPCAGFSGRLIGAFCSGVVQRYIGIDLSQKTIQGLCKTKTILNKINQEFLADIVYGNCIDVMAETVEKVDFVFTSPPFLDEEEYTGVDVVRDYDKWKEIFIGPFIRGSYSVLKPGGQLAVYTEAIRRNDFPVDFGNIAAETGFDRMKDIRFKVPARENLRKDRTHREVGVIVFRRPT